MPLPVQEGKSAVCSVEVVEMETLIKKCEMEPPLRLWETPSRNVIKRKFLLPHTTRMGWGWSGELSGLWGGCHVKMGREMVK